jgi:hypothetical protein
MNPTSGLQQIDQLELRYPDEGRELGEVLTRRDPAVMAEFRQMTAQRRNVGDG